MSVMVVTGAGGLVGSETVRHFAGDGYRIIGIDNDMRARFFGREASTRGVVDRLEKEIAHFENHDIDIRDQERLQAVFKRYGGEISLVVHTAAQPSHDWAAKEPHTDFTVNANGTLNLLELQRQHCPEAVFIFTSTNKVYGDRPNSLPLEELETRWELNKEHRFYQNGIDESMSIDRSLHSLFGASKVAADVLVQEYGRYFGMKTGVFRGGCLTGPSHAGAELHGFLAYLMKCAATGTRYRIYGYKGKQVRDNIHSDDLVRCFRAFFEEPRPGEVYNIGGSRYSHCSMQEAIAMCEEITGRKMDVEYVDQARIGDHIWYVSDISRFRQHYPDWKQTWAVDAILQDIFDVNRRSWGVEKQA